MLLRGGAVAAPPAAREGERGRVTGRLLVAGVAPFARELSARASAADLWSSIEALAVDGAGIERLEKRHGVTLDAESRRRFIAYVGQARQYYEVVRGITPAAKPLPAYYFVLNLTKAFLTAVDPGTTAPDQIRHGVSARFIRKNRYRIQQERIGVSQNGVFRLLAERTGMRHCYGSGYEIRLVDLLPYLPEGYDLYADALDEAPKLVPVEDAYPLFAGKAGWLRVEIDRDVLKQRGIGPAAVPKRCGAFGSNFRLVQSGLDTASFESIATVPYGNSTRQAALGLTELFDRTLLLSNRTLRGPRRYVVVSTRAQLLSHEAITFAVLHHMSSMVRYRPQDVERLEGSRYFWLFSAWLDRACENILLNLASRITGEEHVVE